MMQSRTLVLFGFMALFITGCATGSISYDRPKGLPPKEILRDKYEQVVDYDIDFVWKKTIDYISATFFVIDNLEKSSYFINLSYSVDDPTQYIDCGTIHYMVSNARGKRNYDFLGASAYEQYETMGNVLAGCIRKIQLNGKVNILLSRVGGTKTKIKVNARYVIAKNIKCYDPANKFLGEHAYTMSLNSGNCGEEPGVDLVCCPKHELEIDIIEGIKKRLSGT